MDNTTFREVSISNQEAENLVGIEQTISPSPSPFSGTQVKDKLIPPLSIYETVKGKPYSVDFLGIGKEWLLPANTPSSKEVVEKLKLKVGAIESYVKNQIKDRYLDDNVDSYKKVLKMIDKITNFSTETNPHERVNKIVSFILFKNKTKAFSDLRKALTNNALDQLIDTNEINPSIIGKFMPRKD